MKYIKFQDKNGSFSIENPENYSGLYIPLAGENGLNPRSPLLWEETANWIRIIFCWNR